MNATEHMEARRRAEEEPERARISSHETATAEASELARHRDPSLTDKDVAAAAAKKKARGVGVGASVRPAGLSQRPACGSGHRLPGRALPPSPAPAGADLPGDADRDADDERAGAEAAPGDGVRPRFRGAVLVGVAFRDRARVR